MRLAVSDSLRAAVEAAGGAGVQLVPAASADARLRARDIQIWRERTRARGASEADAEAALQDPSCRALLAALDRRADAVLLSESDPGCQAAWALLEPKAGASCADVHLADGPARFAWAEPTPAAAAAALSLAAGPVALVLFGVRRDPPPAFGRLAETLKARVSARTAWIYSPLCFRDGRLDARRWWAALAPQIPAGSTPVVCVPGLARTELAAAWRAAGGTWSGALRAAAELPAARLALGARAEDVAATVRALAG